MECGCVCDLPLVVDLVVEGETVVEVDEARVSELDHKSTALLVAPHEHVATAYVAMYLRRPTDVHLTLLSPTQSQGFNTLLFVVNITLKTEIFLL